MTTTEGSRLSRWLWGPYSSLALKIAAVTFIVDQAHKWWMLLGYKIAEKGRVTITPFFDLVFVKNTGISYSLFDGSTYSWQLVLALFSVVASLGLWIWLAVAGTGRLMAWALGLIMGGALANGLDRLLIGGVADFFSFHAFGFYWYVFNIADVAIVVGVAALLYESFVGSRNGAAKPM
ncbi:MAG TPA: signal peptidase II [Hyphomicrobium sp.]|nr:signal peptidase II [Hyphomicrobium sp.]